MFVSIVLHDELDRVIAHNDGGKRVSEANPFDRFVRCLLALTARHDVSDQLMWTEDLEFAVNCNDAFWWGTADAEDVTPETLPELGHSLEDGGEDGMLLYCARRRKMRPQGAMYKHIKKPELFNVFPEREVGFGNPHKPDGT